MMKLASVIVIFIGIISAGQSDVPILGPVLGTISNVSRGVINTAIDTVGYVGTESYDLISDNIRQIIENFKELMVDAIPLLGLPQLEPLSIDHVDIDIDHEIGKFQGTMDNVVLAGLKKFKTQDIVVNGLLPMHLRINITIDRLDMTGIYNVTGVAGELIKVHGNGPFTLVLYKNDVGIDVKLRPVGKSIQVEQLHLTYKLGSVKCNFENLMGGGSTGDLFNKVLSDVAPEAVDNLWPEIEPLLSQKLEEAGTKMLAQFTIKDIIDIIMGKNKVLLFQ